MTVPEYAHQLGEATRHGWGFLAAYGATWLACAWMWRTASPRSAAFATLFQGMVALPLALALTAVTPGPPRPELAGMDAASVLLASGQLLALPVVAILVASGHHTWVPLIMSTVLAIHFAPYSWLYGTPLYLVSGAVVAIAVALQTADRLRPGPDASEEPPSGPGAVAAERTCLATGLVLLASSAIAWVL